MQQRQHSMQNQQRLKAHARFFCHHPSRDYVCQKQDTRPEQTPELENSSPALPFRRKHDMSSSMNE
eukprot:466951-Amphidinium_carterae.1